MSVLCTSFNLHGSMQLLKTVYGIGSAHDLLETTSNPEPIITSKMFSYLWVKDYLRNLL